MWKSDLRRICEDKVFHELHFRVETDEGSDPEAIQFLYGELRGSLEVCLVIKHMQGNWQ